jgi:hypothetical protein
MIKNKNNLPQRHRDTEKTEPRAVLKEAGKRLIIAVELLTSSVPLCLCGRALRFAK